MFYFWEGITVFLACLIKVGKFDADLHSAITLLY